MFFDYFAFFSIRKEQEDMWLIYFWFQDSAAPDKIWLRNVQKRKLYPIWCAFFRASNLYQPNDFWFFPYWENCKILEKMRFFLILGGNTGPPHCSRQNPEPIAMLLTMETMPSMPAHHPECLSNVMQSEVCVNFRMMPSIPSIPAFLHSWAATHLYYGQRVYIESWGATKTMPLSDFVTFYALLVVL